VLDENGDFVPAVRTCLEMTARHDMILATGTWDGARSSCWSAVRGVARAGGAYSSKGKPV
jgi:hypothetical protein